MKEASNNNIWEIATIAFEYCISKQKELKSNGTNFTFQLMTKYNEAVSDNTYDNNIKHEIILDIYKKFQGFSEVLNPSKHKDNTKTNDDLEEISWDFSIQPYLENENGKKQLAKLFVFIHELLYNYDIDETIRKRKNMPFEIESKAPYRKMLSMLKSSNLKHEKFTGFFTKFIEMDTRGNNFREKYDSYRCNNIIDILEKKCKLLIIRKDILANDGDLNPNIFEQKEMIVEHLEKNDVYNKYIRNFSLVENIKVTENIIEQSNLSILQYISDADYVVNFARTICLIVDIILNKYLKKKNENKITDITSYINDFKPDEISENITLATVDFYSFLVYIDIRNRIKSEIKALENIFVFFTVDEIIEFVLSSMEILDSPETPQKSFLQLCENLKGQEQSKIRVKNGKKIDKRIDNVIDNPNFEGNEDGDIVIFAMENICDIWNGNLEPIQCEKVNAARIAIRKALYDKVFAFGNNKNGFEHNCNFSVCYKKLIQLYEYIIEYMNGKKAQV